MPLMSDQARQSFRKSSGRVHCYHCGHEGPSKIERRSAAHWVICTILVLVGLVFLWPSLVVGMIWIAGIALAGDRHVCMHCGSDNHIDLAFYQEKNR